MPDQYQTDLFSEGRNAGATIINSALIDALLADEIDKASEELSRLEETKPDHPSVEPARLLVQALKLPPPSGFDQAIERQAKMLKSWIGASDSLFDSIRTSLLNRIWNDIGHALQPLPYDPNLPDRHTSAAYQHGEDWQNAAKSVLSVQYHMDEPVLMTRLADAYSKLGDNIKSMNIWFEMCQKFPEDFERQIGQDNFPDQKLKRIWDHAVGLSLKPAMSPEWFPVWTMLADPGSAKWLSKLPGNTKSSEAFRLVKELLTHQHADRKGLNLRKALHDINPELLKRFMDDIGTNSTPPQIST